MAVDARVVLAQTMLRTALWARREDSFWARLERARQLQHATAEKLQSAQLEALAHLLRRVVPHVPFYREYRAILTDVTPATAISALELLPIVQKPVLQQSAESLRSAAWRGREAVKTTGGSTGRPVTVRKNADAVAQEMAATWMAYGWFGLQPADRCVRFWGVPSNNVRRRLRYIAADAATNRRTLSAFGYTDRELHGYLSAIQRFRPAFLYGYVSALEELARYATKVGYQTPDSLKVVVTTSEVLSEPQRRTIQSAFGVPVQNEYGCGELGPIAYECRSGSLHLLPVNQYVEIVDDEGSPTPFGETGNLVITDLNNFAMPLVRYGVGDLGSFGPPCDCTLPFPVLRSVVGRAYDYVETASGKRYHGEFFMYLFEDLRSSLPDLGQFQIVQHTPTEMEVRIVSDAGEPTSILQAVHDGFRRRIPELTTSVVAVPALSRRPSGKMQVVESRVRRPAT